MVSEGMSGAGVGGSPCLNVPISSQHRGSHCASQMGGQAFVIGGGGMRANLSSVKASEGEGAVEESAGEMQRVPPTCVQVLRNRRWEPAPPLKQPRHAFAVAANDG